MAPGKFDRTSAVLDIPDVEQLLHPSENRKMAELGQVVRVRLPVEECRRQRVPCRVCRGIVVDVDEDGHADVDLDAGLGTVRTVSEWLESVHPFETDAEQHINPLSSVEEQVEGWKEAGATLFRLGDRIAALDAYRRAIRLLLDSAGATPLEYAPIGGYVLVQDPSISRGERPKSASLRLATVAFVDEDDGTADVIHEHTLLRRAARIRYVMEQSSPHGEVGAGGDPSSSSLEPDAPPADEDGIPWHRLAPVPAQDSSDPRLSMGVTLALNIARCGLLIKQQADRLGVWLKGGPELLLEAVQHCDRALCFLCMQLPRAEIEQAAEASAEAAAQWWSASEPLIHRAGTVTFVRARLNTLWGRTADGKRDARRASLLLPEDQQGEIDALLGEVEARKHRKARSNKQLAKHMSRWIQDAMNASEMHDPESGGMGAGEDMEDDDDEGEEEDDVGGMRAAGGGGGTFG